MSFFKNILVPTDFGPAATRALDVAIALATRDDARITLLHAYMTPVATYGYGEGIVWPIEDLAAVAKAQLDAALEPAKCRYPRIEGMLVVGEPWNEVLDVAKKRNADLIVMGTHGRKGLSRVLFGSVAEKVVRLSPVPVLTVPSKEEEEATDERPAAGAPTPR
jgi:nucleotide-binding universal stress UspA family protein